MRRRVDLPENRDVKLSSFHILFLFLFAIQSAGADGELDAYIEGKLASTIVGR
jgi:hypothetical protein